MKRHVLTMILAGGRGTRLEPLTRDRAKPAVPFGGIYRIIDFTLSNCINSGLRTIYVVTQFKSRSLDRHIRRGWNIVSPELGEMIDILPPQQRIDEHWYKGTADAVYQNIYSIEKDNPTYVLILAGDHIYKMDYSDIIDFHTASKADLTIGCIPVPLTEVNQFGIMETDEWPSYWFSGETGHRETDARRFRVRARLDGHLCLQHPYAFRATLS